MAVRRRTDRNSWLVDVVINDRRIRESYKTKREAVARERELIAQEATGHFPEPVVDIRFDEFVLLYLQHAEVNKAPKTVYNERWMLRSNLMPFFGTMKLSRITPTVLERYKAKRHRDGMSPRTINMELQLLSVMFRLAIRLGYVRRNPIRDVARVREVKNPPRYLTKEEARRFLNAAKETYLYPLVVTALCTGMRKSELFHLCWSDIDFDTRTIVVQSKEDWHTKNRQYRTVEMTDFLRRVLWKEYERRDPENPYVFTYGGKRLRWTVKKTLRTISRKAGVENVTLHVLRHTFASHLAMQGVPLMHIQQLLGHSDYNTTLIYAHISSESPKGQVHRLPFDDEEREP